MTDVLFRPMLAFFIAELGSRRVIHVGVTRAPTDAWVAQQLREATPDGAGPRFLIHDHDAKYRSALARLAAASGIEVIRTPIRAPRANAVRERFLGSVRRECVDHTLVLGERHLRRVLAEYVGFFNRDRPHQGIEQRAPVSVGARETRRPTPDGGRVIAIPVLGGLHHAYRSAA